MRQFIRFFEGQVVAVWAFEVEIGTVFNMKTTHTAYTWYHTCLCTDVADAAFATLIDSGRREKSF